MPQRSSARRNFGRLAVSDGVSRVRAEATVAAEPPVAGDVPQDGAASSTRSLTYLYILIIVVGVVRLAMLGAYPLTDNTEARYAEIARKMVETGQWLVPQIDYGVPFWGKPPLSMWLSAVSYETFGISAFAARLPSLLLGVGICLLAYRLAAGRRGKEYGLRAVVAVATSLLMLVSAGAVMTDPAMVFGTTLSMVGYWLAMSEHSRRWGYLFFVGLAVGLLAKGPVATVLTLLPIAAWAVLTGRVADSWRRLPWLGGSVLVLALVVPWYWAAELHSPGFLRYFIVGEHVERFLVPGWTGDLYGAGHAYPRGTIWLFALAGTLPWSPWLLWQVARRGALRPSSPSWAGDGWVPYLVCWTLAPLVFFTLSRNILPTYFLPGLVGFGLLVAEAWQRRATVAPMPHVVLLGFAAPALLVAALVAGTYIGFQSQHDIVSAYAAAPERNASLIYYRQRPSSAEFYSQGSAEHADDDAALGDRLDRLPHAYVATEASALARMPPGLRARLVEVATSQTGKYVLLRELPAASASNAARAAPGESASTASASTGKLKVAQE